MEREGRPSGLLVELLEQQLSQRLGHLSRRSRPATARDGHRRRLDSADREESERHRFSWLRAVRSLRSRRQISMRQHNDAVRDEGRFSPHGRCASREWHRCDSGHGVESLERGRLGERRCRRAGPVRLGFDTIQEFPLRLLCHTSWRRQRRRLRGPARALSKKLAKFSSEPCPQCRRPGRHHRELLRPGHLLLERRVRPEQQLQLQPGAVSELHAKRHSRLVHLAEKADRRGRLPARRCETFRDLGDPGFSLEPRLQRGVRFGRQPDVCRGGIRRQHFRDGLLGGRGEREQRRRVRSRRQLRLQPARRIKKHGRFVRFIRSRFPPLRATESALAHRAVCEQP